MTMPQVQESQSGSKLQQEEVLTLPEAASYLRVTEEALAKLVEDDAIPAQKIGAEWRFLKRALTVWLGSGRRYCRDMQGFPPWLFEYPFVDELGHLIVQRVRGELGLTEEQPPPKPGSKQAVLKNSAFPGTILASSKCLTTSLTGKGGRNCERHKRDLPEWSNRSR
jgi:excisionase family DNA binding protein